LEAGQSGSLVRVNATPDLRQALLILAESTRLMAQAA
jgi:hypothetical protein